MSLGTNGRNKRPRDNISNDANYTDEEYKNGRDRRAFEEMQRSLG